MIKFARIIELPEAQVLVYIDKNDEEKYELVTVTETEHIGLKLTMGTWADREKADYYLNKYGPEQAAQLYKIAKETGG